MSDSSMVSERGQMRSLGRGFTPYKWAPATDAIARATGIDPVEIIRFDANVRAQPLSSSRPATVAGQLAEINCYPHGGYPELVAAIAEYAGVRPSNVVLGAGADDLILLCARSFAGPGDTIAIANDPTYPLFAVAARIAGADIGTDDPVLTFCCRPNNPTGEMCGLPSARPLVVDEAYYEYAGETAAGKLGDGIIVLRTFSKAFGLAGARVGYLLAAEDVAEELRQRQAPAPVSTVSASLAVAALASGIDVSAEVEERERVARALRALGLHPLPSQTNFLFVPTDGAGSLCDALLVDGIVVRALPGGIRISVRDPGDDDLLLATLARVLNRSVPVIPFGGRRVRHTRVTGETRVRVRFGVDGEGRVRVASGAGVYDHFVEQLAFHANFDLVLEAAGDLETGEHHTAEDIALAFGEALNRALGDRRGIARYGHAAVVMDDAVARAVVDLGGRPYSQIALEQDPGLARHMLTSLATAGRLGLHVDGTGSDPHHVAEAAFKAVGRALGSAARREGDRVPSTKGVL